jgi:Sulfatase
MSAATPETAAASGHSAGHGAGGRSVTERFIPSFVIVFLLFAPQLAALASDRNRYFLFWERLDTLAACASILLLSLLGVALGALVDRTGSAWLRDLRDQVVVGLFALGVLANLLPLLHVRHAFDYLKEHRGPATALFRLGLAGVLAGWALLLIYRRALLPRLVRVACLILSPIIPIVLLPALFWSGWSVRPDPLPRIPASPRPGTPIYVVVFDEWSFLRGTEGDDFPSDLPRLRDLRARSFFFRQSRSPSRTTYLSLPELIFQSHDFPSLPNVFLMKSDFPDRVKPDAPDDGITPAAPGGRPPPNLFSMARGRNYATALLGYYLPYRSILDGDVDLVRSYCDYPRGESFGDKMLEVTIQNPHFWRLPVVSRIWKRLYAGVFSRNWVQLNQQLVDDFDAVVMNSPERSFVFLHFPAPHAPFIYAEDGSYRGPFPIRSGMTEDIDIDVMGGSPDDYHTNLRHLDRVMGHFMDTLRAAGRFDDALVIVTSDHSWRYEPTLSGPTAADLVRHVPLLIKTPGQSDARTIDGPFDGRSLGPIIERAMSGQLDTAAAAALIPTLTDSGPTEPRRATAPSVAPPPDTNGPTPD